MPLDGAPSLDCGDSWIQSPGRAVDALLRHLPEGVAWLSWRIPGKTAAKFVTALAKAYDDIWRALCRLAYELDPRTTTEMITEWEGALGLPDPCLPAATTLDERRAQVQFRLQRRRWTNAQDWHDLAALFGFTIRITPGWYVQRPCLFGDDTSPFTEYDFPLRFDIYPRLGRFRVYIDIIGATFLGFEYGEGANQSVGWPIPFLGDDSRFTALQCIFDRIRPANVVIIWNSNPLYNYCTAETFEQTFSDTFCGVEAGDVGGT